VDSALIASAALLGLAGAPHCTLMCGAPCAAAVGGGGSRATLAFHIGRLASYAAGGAVAAASVSALGEWSRASPALRPAWAMLHAAVLVFGAWLVWQGRQPRWLAAWGRAPAADVARGWRPLRGPTRAGVSGSLWVAWPCGLLQSALVVAAMTSDAASGAAAMAAFAVASAPGLVVGPWLWLRLVRGGDAATRERWAVRAAGATLIVASGWVLGHGLWSRLAALCAAL
jgi:uncharacterized protein